MGSRAIAKGAPDEVTLREASESLGIPVPTIREWIHRGKTKAVKKWGTRWYLTREEVERIRTWAS